MMYLSCRNGDFAWGIVSGIIPSFPSLIKFASVYHGDNLRTRAIKAIKALRTLPFSQLLYYRFLLKNMLIGLKQILDIDLKILNESNVKKIEILQKERALKVAKVEDRKSTLQDYKIPESFGESLPQCLLQTYIVLVKSRTLVNIVPYLNNDLATNGLLLSTYFSLFASFLSLSLTTSSMLVEYWHFIDGKILKPIQGLMTNLKMMILMVPIVFSRIISISYILASPSTWWIKSTLILILLVLYLLGYFLILSLYKKFHPDESLEGGREIPFPSAV